MVAAFLDSWLTGDPQTDAAVLKFCRPSGPEVASVAGLAARLYLGGAGAPRRYFAWGQAVRRAVLAVVLVHAVLAVDALVRLAWAHRLLGVPAPPVGMGIVPPGGSWTTTGYAVGCAWIVIFMMLVLGRYRAVQDLAALTIVPGLVLLLTQQFNGSQVEPYGAWASWILLDLAPVLAMAAFHRDAPTVARRPWLLALPAGYLLVAVPHLAVQATGHFGWWPDFSGLCCVLVALACLVHALSARFRRGAGAGVWSLTLTLLAAVAAVDRLVSLLDYLHDPHLINVSLAELLILAVAVALVVPDAAHAQTATPLPPRHPLPG
jgi:hypothetical protein